MSKAANKCPACILSALRVRNMSPKGGGSFGVAGPDDGRNEWDYREAKAQWWEERRDPDL